MGPDLYLQLPGPGASVPDLHCPSMCDRHLGGGGGWSSPRRLFKRVPNLLNSPSTKRAIKNLCEEAALKRPHFTQFPFGLSARWNSRLPQPSKYPSVSHWREVLPGHLTLPQPGNLNTLNSASRREIRIYIWEGF